MSLSNPLQVSSTNGNRPLPDISEPVDPVPETKQRYWLAAGLLLATLFTTLMVGVQLQSDFINNHPPFSFVQGIFPLTWIWQQPSRLLLGIPFSATLLLILLFHEMGHFIACKRYGVQATLPYFIPVPWPIGTLGAFIRIRSPFPSRAALFDIGIAGPISGFLVAVPALVAGLSLSKIAPALVRAAELQLGYPAIFDLVRMGEGIHWPMSAIYLHPVAIAAWIGMLATSLNLLPGGQLDGGHILYALWPRAHQKLTWIVVIVLFLMSPFLWAGWLLWASVLLLFGRYHPSVPEQPGLSRARKWLAVFALLISILTFMPAPVLGKALDWHKAVNNVHKMQEWFR